MATTRNKYVDMEVGVDGEDEGLGYEDFDDVDPVEEQKQAAVDHAVRQRVFGRRHERLDDRAHGERESRETRCSGAPLSGFAGFHR